MQGVKLTVDDLPDEIYVDGNEFKFLCCTIHSQKHFRSIFYIDKKLYLIDDLDNRNVNKLHHIRFKQLFIILLKNKQYLNQI